MREIQLGNKPHKVEFTMRAFRTFKQDTGISLLKGKIDLMDESIMVDLVYAGLVGGDENTKVKKSQIENIFTLTLYQEVIGAYSEGILVISGGSEKK